MACILLWSSAVRVHDSQAYARWRRLGAVNLTDLCLMAETSEPCLPSQEPGRAVRVHAAGAEGESRRTWWKRWIRIKDLKAERLFAHHSVISHHPAWLASELMQLARCSPPHGLRQAFHRLLGPLARGRYATLRWLCLISFRVSRQRLCDKRGPPINQSRFVSCWLCVFNELEYGWRHKKSFWMCIDLRLCLLILR